MNNKNDNDSNNNNQQEEKGWVQHESDCPIAQGGDARERVTGDGNRAVVGWWLNCVCVLTVGCRLCRRNQQQGKFILSSGLFISLPP